MSISYDEAEAIALMTDYLGLIDLNEGYVFQCQSRLGCDRQAVWWCFALPECSHCRVALCDPCAALNEKLLAESAPFRLVCRTCGMPKDGTFRKERL